MAHRLPCPRPDVDFRRAIQLGGAGHVLALQGVVPLRHKGAVVNPHLPPRARQRGIAGHRPFGPPQIQQLLAVPFPCLHGIQSVRGCPAQCQHDMGMVIVAALPLLRHGVMQGDVRHHAPVHKMPLHEAAHQLQPLCGVQLVRQRHIELAGKLGVGALLHALDRAPQQLPVFQPRRRTHRHHDFGMGHPFAAAVVVDFAGTVIAHLRPAAVGGGCRRLGAGTPAAVRIQLGGAAKDLP